MTARPLTVIPPKCTGVLTQPEKIILMYKSCFLIFKKNKNIFVITKTVFISISIFKNKKNKKNNVIKCFF
jgi:hypothetical protein